MKPRIAPSGRAAAIVELLRSTLDATDRLDPVERDQLYTALIADLRARHPVSISPLDLGPPTEPIRDPRARGGDR